MTPPAAPHWTLQPHITVDLAKLIELTVGQVRGGDEILSLRDFLVRNAGAPQPVKLRLADVIVSGPS